MILEFPDARERRRRRDQQLRAAAANRYPTAPAAALDAACAELRAIEHAAALLARGFASLQDKRKKKSPGRGGPGDRGLNRAWAARKRAQ